MGAIVPLPGGAYAGANGYKVLNDICRMCGVCIGACPMGAVSISEE